MSTLNVNNINKESGSTLTIGGSGTTVNVSNMVPDVAMSNRNLIINGDQLVNQRGITGSSALNSGGTYFCDRFFSQAGGTSIVVNGERSTDVPDDAFSVSTKFSVATAATATDHYTRITTRLEGYSAKLLGIGTSGNKITLSFWVKTSRAGTHGVTLTTGYRGGTVYDQAGITLSYTVDSANTWERKEITFDSYDTGGSAVWQYDNLLGLQIMFSAGQGSSLGTITATDTWEDHNTSSIAPKSTSAGELWGTSTSDTFFLTGIQIETGSVATPFEHESYAQNLQKCLRYFYRMNGGTIQDSVTASSHGGNTFMLTNFPVEMRAIPTLSDANISQCYVLYGGGSTTYVTTHTGLQFQSTKNYMSYASTTLNSGWSVFGRLYATGSYRQFSAEL